MKRHSKRGSSTVEFAVLTPLVMLLFIGAGDFSRVFYHSIVTAGAAATGSYYGAQSVVESADKNEIESRASTDAGDLNLSASATASLRCECPPDDGGNIAVVDCLTGTCTGYGVPRVYIRTRVQQSVDPLIPWPSLPSTYSVSRNAWLRVQ